MSNFDAHKWFKNQYLQEANLNEEKSKNERIFDVFYDELEDFDGVAEYLNRYKRIIMNKLSSIDFDYLPKPSMMEEGEGTTLNLSKADMDSLHNDGKVEIDGHKILYKVEESLNETLTLGDLELGKNFKKGSSLPFPNSDASKVINSQEDLEDYVAQFGADTEIVVGRFGRYEVPEFEVGREEAAATKAAGIKKFGTSA